MRKPVYLFVAALVALLLARPVHAQMHRPILEDVFTLYNLLHRDYSSVEEPEVKQKRLEDDRATVIAILKGYVGENFDSFASAESAKNVASADSFDKKIQESLLFIPKPTSKDDATIKEVPVDLLSKSAKTELDSMTGKSNAALIAKYARLKSLILTKKADFERARQIVRLSEEYLIYSKSLDIISEQLSKIDKKVQSIKSKRDQELLKLLIMQFQGTNLKNPLLEDLTQRFINKYESINRVTADLYAGGDVGSNGPKAAFGLPGIVSSAPMVVDVINQVLMEEIKAEVATAVMNVLKKDFGADLDADTISGIANDNTTFEFKRGMIIEVNGVTRFDWQQQKPVTVEKGSHYLIIDTKNLQNAAFTSITILGTLFPATKLFISQIQPQDMTRTIDLLKEKVREDLKNLLVNLAKLDEEVPWIKEQKKTIPEVAIAFSGIDLMNSLATIKHPVEIFSIVPESEAFKLAANKVDSVNVRCVARMMELFAYSFILEQSGSKSWVSLEFLEPYLNKVDFYRIYFGLVLAQDNKYPAYQITFSPAEGKDPSKNRPVRLLAEWVDQNMNEMKLESMRNIVYRFIQIANYANEQALAIKQSRNKGESPTPQKVVAYAVAMANVVDSTSRLLIQMQHIMGLGDPLTAPLKKVSLVCQHMRTASEIYQALAEKQYVLAVGKAMELVQTLSKKVLQDQPERATAATNTEWMRVANLLVSIAVAENRDDLESAFTQFAHNPGSWRVKRESSLSVSLGVYGGIFLGQDRILKDTYRYTISDSNGTLQDTNVTFNGKSRNKFSSALSLSVGPNIAIGLGRGRCQHSLSLFVPLIDIGAVTAFRFMDTLTPTLPEFDWKDILAPGAYIYYGLPRVPISIGLGAQYNAALRKIKTLDGSAGVVRTEFVDSWRIGTCIAVDLSLITFHSGTKRSSRK